MVKGRNGWIKYPVVQKLDSKKELAQSIYRRAPGCVGCFTKHLGSFYYKNIYI